VNRTKWLVATLAVCLSVAGGSRLVRGQGGVPGLPANQLPINEQTSYKGEEYLLIGNAVRGAGEPVIAINPKNPDNIIVGAMANNHYVEGAPLGTAQQRITIESRVKYRNTPGASISVYAVSHDRGRTWRYFDDPFRDYFGMNGTADAFVGAGADGTLFIGAMNFFPLNASPQMQALEREPDPGLLFGATDMTWSTDQGKTWNHPPIHVMGQASHPMEYGPGVKPVFKGKTPYDRPFLITDLSTGTIYVPGNGSGGEPPHRETFIRASQDNGRTWGLIYAIDSPEYPQSGSASRPAAAHGVLAAAYIASAAPAGSGAQCPCLVFGASRDDGKTFERSVVRAAIPTQQGFGGFGNPSLAADPSRPGRFAVMTLTSGNTEMQVYVTEDYGRIWKGPVQAGHVPGATMTRADMGYSPRGQLAVMWLSVNPDQTYSAWSAASHDGGMTFKPSLQISRGVSPPRSAIRNRGNHWDGDDLSSLAVDNDFVHIVWADGRAGFLGSWYARVPLATY
jgi:hypothetical protein